MSFLCAKLLLILLFTTIYNNTCFSLLSGLNTGYAHFQWIALNYKKAGHHSGKHDKLDGHSK